MTKAEIKLMKKRKEDYVKEGGLYCPYCHSKNIRVGDVDFDSDSAYRNVTCACCCKEWTEVFNLSTITLLEETLA